MADDVLRCSRCETFHSDNVPCPPTPHNLTRQQLRDQLNPLALPDATSEPAALILERIELLALAELCRPHPQKRCESERGGNVPCWTALAGRPTLWCEVCTHRRIAQLLQVTGRLQAERARIQKEFVDDLADRHGVLYEQIKDLVAQFHVEREERAQYPNLLAALKGLVGVLNDDLLPEQAAAWDVAVAAIDKAEGR